jgi:predicted metal-dependent phosphoesterase TrpH
VSKSKPTTNNMPAFIRHSLVSPGEPFGDLHVHTHFSDGKDSPERVVERAAGAGLSFLSVTDHDTVRGVERARKRSEALGIRLISGVEVSATSDQGDIHILGYFVDVEDEHFIANLATVETQRRERVLHMIEKLQGLGVGADADAFFAMNPTGMVGRLALADYLVNEALVRSKEEVFSLYLGMGRPAYEPVNALTTTEALRIIQEAGGVAVMAHPGRTGVDHMIPMLVAEGLSGIEAYHSSHSKTVAESYRRLAESMGLLVTGGSDCHGRDDPEVLLGAVRVAWSFVEALETRASAGRSSGRPSRPPDAGGSIEPNGG